MAKYLMKKARKLSLIQIEEEVKFENLTDWKRILRHKLTAKKWQHFVYVSRD